MREALLWVVMRQDHRHQNPITANLVKFVYHVKQFITTQGTIPSEIYEIEEDFWAQVQRYNDIN